jgi:hypothetical protein
MRVLRLALALSSILAAYAEDVLVTHPSVPVNLVDQVTLRDVFLGRRTTWPNGQRVVVVLMRDGPAHQRLAGELGKTPQQLTNWWKRLVFTGEGNMPEQVDGAPALIARVASLPGAIGWIESPADVPPGVKLLPPP